jgi:teichuronic acid biosynthesis glycosyltransferase TuaG
VAHFTQEDGLVSVVLPVYNAGKYIRRTIESVYAQTYPHWEIVAVIDPGSADNSEEILREMAASNRKLRLFLGNGFGVAPTRNLAIQHSRGRWLSFLDADDMWMPSKLERQMSWMREREAAFSATHFRRIDQSGSRIGRLIKIPKRISRERLIKQNFLCCSSVMVDRKRVRDLSFEPVGCEDYDLWMRLTSRGYEGFGIPEDLVRYRVVASSRGSSKLKTARESWNIIRKNSGLMPAVYNFGNLIVRGAVKHSRF